jgi:hypothetical protein
MVLSQQLDIGHKTAWFLAHRIREAMKTTDADKLGGYGGFVEVDETYVGRREGTQVKKGPASRNPVVSLAEREGRVRSFHVPNVTAANVHPIIGRHVYADTEFQSDESQLYKAQTQH